MYYLITNKVFTGINLNSMNEGEDNEIDKFKDRKFSDLKVECFKINQYLNKMNIT
jgi:hypothetical protein